MMTKRHISLRVVLASVATLVVAGGILVANSRSLQLGYYKWQMERARHQAYDGPRTTDGGFVVANVASESEERYEYYRRKLVELRGIVERHYVFQHLRVPSDESKHLSKLLVSGRCPRYVDFSSPYPDKPEPMQLTVWCRPADASAWDDFAAEHDVPDYHERFIEGGGRGNSRHEPIVTQ